MKHLHSVLLFICLGLCTFAQSNKTSCVVQDTVVSKIQISSDPKDSITNELPQLILLNTIQATKPTVENIASEIPNTDSSQTIVRIRVVTTEELIAKEQKIAQAESAPVTTKITAVDTKKKESYADPEDTIAIPGRTYKIQVFALQKESKETILAIQKDVGKQTPVSIETEGELKKYMVGEFDTYYKATSYRDYLVKKGYKGAFAVVYFKGNRVSRQEKELVKIKK